MSSSIGFNFEQVILNFGKCLVHYIKESILYSNRFGGNHLQISKIMPHIIKLLSDTSQVIREKSFETLLEIYKHVGEKLRNDLRKRQLPDAK